MSYLKSIRAQCRECMGGQLALITTCPSAKCPLFHLRSGKGNPRATETPLKAIHSFCLACVGTAPEVASCTGKTLDGGQCSLHLYRQGKNPRLKGHGGHPPEQFRFGAKLRFSALEKPISHNPALA